MKPFTRITCARCDGKGIVGKWSWGGVEPDECPDCGGGGAIVQYASGALASWPGGPFLGRIVTVPTLPNSRSNEQMEASK